VKSDVKRALGAVERPSGSSALRAEFRFEPEWPVFRGHFPGNPLVPGVLEIEMVRCAVEAVEGPQAVVRVNRAKFTGEIRPNDVIVVEASIGADGPAGRTVKAELRVGQELKASISLQMGGAR